MYFQMKTAFYLYIQHICIYIYSHIQLFKIKTARFDLQVH